MTTNAPVDEVITLQDLDRDPFPIYRRLRAHAPVCHVKAAGRTFLTKAADTKYVKDNPELFSSDDPKTPMKRAFRAHTLMRKDGAAHLRERNAMAQSFGNGPHFCQGTHVARRAIAHVILPILFDRFPNMSLPDPNAVIWRGFGFHGVQNLPVLLQ